MRGEESPLVTEEGSHEGKWAPKRKDKQSHMLVAKTHFAGSSLKICLSAVSCFRKTGGT